MEMIQVNSEGDVKTLKAKIKREQADIEIHQANIQNYKKKLLDIEYPVIGWDDLKQHLLDANHNAKDFSKNPVVCRMDGFRKYSCKINEFGELQIGSYRYADFFKRGEPLRVHYQFKSWDFIMHGI